MRPNKAPGLLRLPRNPIQTPHSEKAAVWLHWLEKMKFLTGLMALAMSLSIARAMEIIMVSAIPA